MGTNNLSDEVKQELIEKHWDINVDQEWWDCVYEDFKTDMKEKGIEIVRIYFSGFSSQGDGACFEGLVPVSQFGKFMDVHNLATKYPAARFFSKSFDLRLDANKVHHRYCHEGTIEVSLHEFMLNCYEDSSPRWEVYDTMQTLFNAEFAQLELDCEEIFKGYMRELYRKLEKEYNYFTSKDAIWETIVANELHLEAA